MREKEGVTVQGSGVQPRAVVERHGAPRDVELLDRVKARDKGAIQRL
jgi:hypothetical protein